LVSAFHDLLTSLGKDGNKLVDVIRAIKQAVKTVKRIDVSFSRVDKSGFPATCMKLDIDEDIGHDQTDVRSIDRNLLACMDAAGLVNQKAREFADSALDIIVDAESRAHGIEDGHEHHDMHGDHEHPHVHLHELASADTLVDILCVARALDLIGAFDDGGGMDVYSSPVSTGRGSIKTAHGILPVPAPGTLEILRTRGIPHRDGPVDDAELATPTGCAILAALKPNFGGMQVAGKVIAVGIGAGTKTFPAVPNILRLELVDISQGGSESAAQAIARYVARSPLQASTDQVAQLTLAIDDMTPEDVGSLIEKSYAQGALEAYAIPAQMKKHRPGIEVIVLCPPSGVPGLLSTWMEESTTLGCRVEIIDRVTIERHVQAFHVTLAANGRSFAGKVMAKFIEWRADAGKAQRGSRSSFKIEHDDVKRVAESLGTSIHAARQLIDHEIRGRSRSIAGMQHGSE
ncbi:MAG: LarC family nickel insertion protein, partial [Candidatus Lokiarchaeota archaeon]|nr:LarC family nickel insertion protein [Candidatus Lokiarchaeota archaeon]